VREDVAHVDRAHVTLERSVVDLAGRLSRDTVDLTFDAVLPDLANWYPPAAGAIRAAGSLQGNARNPTVDVELTADRITVEALPPIEELDLDVSGTLADHAARFSARNAYGQLRARLEQGWNGERLAGSLVESHVDTPRAGAWTLTAPADYTIAGASIELDASCYRGPDRARLCFAVADDTLSVDAAEVPSALAEPWLGADLRVAGAADLALER
jgi:hypothetical protein